MGQSRAAGINNGEVIVGSVNIPPSGAVVRWVNQQPQVLATGDAALCVNTAGVVGGHVSTHAALWQADGTLQHLGNFSGTGAAVVAVNDRGQAVISIAQHEQRTLVRWQGGQATAPHEADWWCRSLIGASKRIVFVLVGPYYWRQHSTPMTLSLRQPTGESPCLI
jgi:uncharacterized membrane protein